MYVCTYEYLFLLVSSCKRKTLSLPATYVHTYQTYSGYYHTMSCVCTYMYVCTYVRRHTHTHTHTHKVRTCTHMYMPHVRTCAQYLLLGFSFLACSAIFLLFLGGRTFLDGGGAFLPLGCLGLVFLAVIRKEYPITHAWVHNTYLMFP